MQKLLEKCPLRYSLVQNLGWVDPTQIVQNPDKCKRKLKVCLDHLVSAKQMKEGNCDDILKQFSDFSTYCRADEEFVTYDPQSRLDFLMYKLMANKPEWKNFGENGPLAVSWTSLS